MNFYFIWLEHKAKSPGRSRRKSEAFIATEFIIFLFLFLWRQLFLLRLIHRPKADDLVIFVFRLLFAFPRLPIKKEYGRGLDGRFAPFTECFNNENSRR